MIFNKNTCKPIHTKKLIPKQAQVKGTQITNDVICQSDINYYTIGEHFKYHYHFLIKEQHNDNERRLKHNVYITTPIRNVIWPNQGKYKDTYSRHVSNYKGLKVQQLYHIG